MKRELDERIADWVDGRLPPRDLERLEAEFRVNAELRRAAEEYRRSVEHVRRALAQPEPPVNLADQVLEKIQLLGTRPRLGKMLPMLASVAAAAAMVMLFVTLNRIEPAGDGSVQNTARAEPEPAESPAVLFNKITDPDGVVAANQPERENAARAQAGEEQRDRLLEQAGEVAAARKAADVAKTSDVAGDDRLRTEKEVDNEVAAAGGRAVPTPGAPVAGPDSMAPVPLAEDTVWVQSVLGDAEVRADEQGQAEQRERDRLLLAEGRPSLDEDRAAGNRPAQERPDVASSTPVVVIDLPPGQDLKAETLGASNLGGVTGEGIIDRARRASALEEKNTADDVSRSAQLKQQAFQETLDLALLPMSNATPPDVAEIDGNGLVTLEGTLGFEDRMQRDPAAGYAPQLRGLPADSPDGRGFLVQGERQQVATFLRQMADWGRAQGGQVGISQVAETVVVQAQLQQAQLPGKAGAEADEVARLQRSLLEDRQAGRRGGRGRPSAPPVEEISVVLLFRSAR